MDERLDPAPVLPSPALRGPVLPGPVLPAPVMLGRGSEQRLIEGLLSRSRRVGECLVLVGARGSGKTSLLELARHTAITTGSAALNVVPAHSGNATPSPLDPLAVSLTGVPTTRLSTDRLTAGNELLRILGTASHQRPVLVTIDDADALDARSAATLAFAARRLNASRVALLVTVGPSDGSFPDTGVGRHTLDPLSPDASAELLARVPGLNDPVAGRLLAAAEGNPLALVELPKALSQEQLRGAAPLPAVLPLTARLRDVYRVPLKQLSSSARDMLLMVALIGTVDLVTLATTGVGGVDPVTEAEQHGLVTVDHHRQNRVTVSHPLWRSAVLETADQSQLRQARARLAIAVGDAPDQQAWQLAHAVEGTDASVADLLERAAERATDRARAEEAARALVRSAELSPRASQRSSRLLAAAHLRATVTGELDRAAHLVRAATRDDPDAMRSLRAASTSAHLLLGDGARLDEVRELLVEAMNDAVHTRVQDDAATLEAFQLLFYTALLGASGEGWESFRQLVQRLRPPFPPSLALLCSVLPDVTLVSNETHARLERGIRALSLDTDPADTIRVSIAAFHLDRLQDCRPTLVQMTESARAGHSVSTGVEAMLRLSLDDCTTGQLDSAAALASEGLELSTRIGHSDRAWAFQLCLALVAALRGDDADVASLTSEMSAWAEPRGARLVTQHCAHIRGLAALGRGDFGTAYGHLIRISPAGTLDPDTTQSALASLDLVEAALHTNRRTEARAHAAAMSASGMAELSPRLALRVATATALIARDEDAEARFAEAMTLAARTTRWPYEQARLELGYGERLRRLRMPVRARPQLSAAYETFRRLDMRSWAQRAAEEMRASGLPLPPAERPRAPALSVRDQAIASLAAAGLSNQEIGDKLFLSPRTIGSRLHHIYPQLGVTSRAGLRDVMNPPPRQ